MQTNKSVPKIYTHEGGVASRVSPLEQLRRRVLTCLLWEDTFYEKGSVVAESIANLVEQCSVLDVCELAVKARKEMHLRHAPLWLMRCVVAKRAQDKQKQVKTHEGSAIADAVAEIVQRPDELSEMLALYWKDKKQPIAAALKKGLARAFKKFSAYSLAKYDQQDKAVKLRDVLFMVHGKPKDNEQAEVWKKLVNKSLESPDTWEVALSGGADKKETFERLLKEGKLGGLATLRNLRNMTQAGVSTQLIRARLAAGCEKALPFRFVTAARYCPTLEPSIEIAMMAALEGVERLEGSTGLLVDVSGSMETGLSNRGETTRIDAAAGLAILLREIADEVQVATFSRKAVVVPARRGFALRDAIVNSQGHSSTWLGEALKTLYEPWKGLDRVIIITDEQAQDSIRTDYPNKHKYIINVGAYKNGVGYDKGWQHINGWSERVVDYIKAIEEEN